jgi:16S rRNA (cytosine967-C5)-methyltransferase
MIGKRRKENVRGRTPTSGGAGGAGPRDAAMWALARVERDGAFLDRLISELHSRAGKDPRDQNLAEAIVKGVLENQVALENLLRPLVEKFDTSSPDLRAALFVGAAQLKVLTGIPSHAAVSETVNAARRSLGPTRAGLVNAVMRKVSASNIPLEQLSALPLWVNNRFTRQYRDEAPALLEALDQSLPLYVRVNPLRSTVDNCIALFKSVGVTAKRFDALPGTLSLDLNGVRIPDQIFEQGVCTVQDPSASLVAFAMDPKPGERILDLCSAPGGKTTHIAELLENRGEILATDINEKRLGLVEEHAKRLGLSVIQTKQLDASAAQHGIPGDQAFDRVLVDAPCTGTGVFSRKRDALARKKESDLVKLVETQRTLLAAAAPLVRSNGGTLVYSTCSLDMAENEEQIALFLKEHPNFSLVQEHPHFVPGAKGGVDPSFVSQGGFIKALPHRHGCAGGFAAVLRRNG